MSEDWIEFEGHYLDVVPLNKDRQHAAEEAKLYRIAILRNGRSLARCRTHTDAVQVAQTLAHNMDLCEAISELAVDCEEIPDELSKEELLARIKLLDESVNNPPKPSDPADNIPF